MKMNIKVLLALFLVASFILCAGCAKKPSVPADNKVIIDENTSEPQESTGDPLSEDVQVDIDVGWQDDDDLETTAPADDDDKKPADDDGKKPADDDDKKPADDDDTKPADDDDTKPADDDDTKPADDDDTKPADDDDTKPADDDNETVVPGETTEATEPDTPDVPAPGSLTYEQFYQLTPEQQEQYIDSFESLKAFNKWFNEAKAVYESNIPDETINGSVDLDKLNP